MRIGVISDTHGLMREEALDALRGSELILHAGDIGSAAVLDALQQLAPVVAIRGNNDADAWAAHLPEQEEVTIGAHRIMLIHDRKTLRFGRHAAHPQIVISGHSHKPLIETLEGVLYLNPGSAGPRRFSLPVSVAQLQLEPTTAQAAIHLLLPR